MPGGYTYTEANQALDQALNDVAPTYPASWWVALYTSAPSKSGGGTEAAYTSYARVEIERDGTAFTSPPVAGRAVNLADIVFPTPTADGSPVVAFALMSASSGGNRHFFGTVSPSVAVENGKPLRFPAGSLEITG